jgi:hypothetical protein
MQQQFRCHGKLSRKGKKKLHDWNECVLEAKLDDLRVDYFAKQKKDWTEEQGISIVMRGRKGRECGVRSGREQLMYTSSSERLWLFFDT